MIDFKIDKVNILQILDMNTLEPITEFNDIGDVTIESEIETSSLSKETLSINHEASFECELTDCSSLLNYAANVNDKPFYVEYYIPILIQARWHKKKRINKKWLKRYGMKEDRILATADVSNIVFDTERENLYEVEYTMTLDNVHYKFRPDQLRKHLKIELYYG